VSACEARYVVAAIDHTDDNFMKIVLALVALGGIAHADGGYVLGEIGGTGMRGDLQARSNGAVRLRGGLGIVIDDWSFEGWGAAETTDFFNIDGCVPACAASAPSPASLMTFGLDIRRNFTLVGGHPQRKLSKFFRPRLQMFLHGGVREARGEDGITGYAGPGLGGGAGIEINVRIFTGYIEFGGDRFVMTAPGAGPLDVQTFHIVLGERIGFSL
jgi:hypothetical protein